MVVLAIFQHNQICQDCWKNTRSTLECMVILKSRGKVQKRWTTTGQICPVISTRIWTLFPGLENNHTFKCWSGIFPTILTYMIMLENWQNNISVYGCSLIQGTTPYSCWNLMKPGCQSGTYKELLKLATLTKNMCSQLNQDLGGDSILGKVVKVKYLWGHSVYAMLLKRHKINLSSVVLFTLIATGQFFDKLRS